MNKNNRKQNLVIIASSTGGTEANKIIFDKLPLLECCIIIIQHNRSFMEQSFCNSLNKVTDMSISIASSTQPIKHGLVYIAPGGTHLVKAMGDTLITKDGNEVNYVCPSADVTMKSFNESDLYTYTAIVLTGMGEDGAKGLIHIKKIGGITIAQNKQSSVAWGMPARAIETQMVDHILTPEQIKAYLIECFMP